MVGKEVYFEHSENSHDDTLKKRLTKSCSGSQRLSWMMKLINYHIIFVKCRKHFWYFTQFEANKDYYCRFFFYFDSSENICINLIFTLQSVSVRILITIRFTKIQSSSFLCNFYYNSCLNISILFIVVYIYS